MGYLASREDADNDPEVTVTSGPTGGGVQSVPTTPINLDPGLPVLPPEQVQAPSVTITIEAPSDVGDPTPDDIPEAVTVEPQES